MGNGDIHGVEGCPEDVDAVYLKVVDRSDSPRRCVVLDLLAQHRTLLGGELFRVVEQRVAVVVREYDSSGEDGAGKASATGFVTTGFNEVSM